MVHLESLASYIITDSGGVQKEAYFHKKPCLVLREETEWQELVDNSWAVLVKDFSKKVILNQFDILTKQKAKDVDLYGGGNTGEIIVSKIENFLIQ